MDRKEKVERIKRIALEMRRHCLEMGRAAGGFGAHFGPALSCVEEIACLYFGVMNHDPQNPAMPGRDRFVLSKGHACLSFYAALAEAGYFPKGEMKSFKGNGSFLTGHPGCHPEYGIESASGSLGNGFGIACGMAMAAKVQKQSHNVYCIVGDGECNEGVVLEAAMNAANHKLTNIIAIVDRNGYQLSGRTSEIMRVDLEAVWKALGWEVILVEDGNDVESLLTALENAAASEAEKPRVIIANSLKGKGVSFMEDNLAWHAAPISEEEYLLAKQELYA